jgi:hypothetical protein
VFHVVAGAGTLAQHVKQESGKTITDGASSQRRAEIPMEVFDAMMAAALRTKAKEYPQAFYQELPTCRSGPSFSST